MPSKKAAAAAAADSQKKRKRDKAEEAAHSKKRRGQAEKETAAEQTPRLNGGAGELVQPESRAIANRPTTWKLSEPMGGSMSDIDPIFTPDEEHIIIVYRTSIQIFSTADSLLERRIKLPEQNGAARIVAAALSPQSSELVWIGCAHGALYRANWTSGEIERIKRKQQPAPRLAGLTAELVQLGPLTKEVLYLSEGVPNAWSVVAYDATMLAKTTGRILFTAPGGSSATAIDLLRTANDGRFVVGASGKTVFVGGLKTTESKTAGTVNDLAYQFYSLDAADDVSCLDVRATVHKKRGACLDLVIGCLRGAIYVYDDILNRLQLAAAESSRKKKVGVRPQKHHWHSRSVNAVKWSRDGNYFISGGPESVLVVWQTETSKLDFLPHLSASIENIVVSPRGASYALHLDDNSSMVVSTAEMKPVFYVSGLQTLTLAPAPAKDANVRRAFQPMEAITKPIPAAVDPSDASRIWLRVGNGQKASLTGEMPSSSLLQTFDVSSFRSVGKQPLARTNPTDANMTRSGMPVTEPTITQLCASRDGRWLASVDEWQPPERDMSGLPGEASLQREWARDRREVHLKFWSVTDRSSSGDDDKDGVTSAVPEQYELVTRIDEAHFTNKAETIFAVEADTRHASRFATLGDDGVVRFWGVKTRMRDGLVAKDDRGRPLLSWQCTQSVPLPLGESDDDASKTASLFGSSALTTPKETHSNKDSSQASRRSGALAFSEDGSTVFAAFGSSDGSAVLYTIDAESGVVRGTLQGLFRGAVRGIAVMGASLVLLSADLRVYDIVADELRYGLRIVENVAAADLGAALNLTQMAVGRLSNTFIVAVPYKLGEASTTTAASSARFVSRLIVYSPDQPEPLFTKNLPYLVVSLLPAVGLSGFLAIDSAAQVWSIADAADTTSLGQSLADLNLPTVESAPVELNGDAGEESEDNADDEEDEEMNDANDAGTAVGEDDNTYGVEDMHDVVIAPQKLKEIFEAAPATAGTSIEALFWQVSGLLSSLPSVAEAA